MKLFRCILLLILLGSLPVSQANADSTIYLVRHAEKQNDGTNDPHLTEQGHQRAGYLAQQLSLANISKIYSSDYHRTRQTAKPLADLLGLSIVLYDPQNLEAFAESLKTQTGQIVIVGHSNTTPPLAALISGSEVDAMDESEYQNLYQIVSINGKTQLTRFKIFPIDLTPPVESTVVAPSRVNASASATKAKKRARKRVKKK